MMIDGRHITEDEYLDLLLNSLRCTEKEGLKMYCIRLLLAQITKGLVCSSFNEPSLLVQAR